MSAGEIAELTGKTRQAVDKYAKKNNWPFEEDTGQARGGKLKKYLIAALPPEVQAAIREKQAATLLAKVPVLPAEVKKPLRQNKKMRQLGLIPCEEGLARLDDRQTETAHARCAIVGHVLPLHELGGMPIKKAVAFVVAEAAAGRLPEDVARLIPLANARNNGERGLSEPTLYRWVRAYRAAPDSMSRLLALAPVKTREKMKEMKSATEQLREELFDTLHRLKTGQIDAATAQAVSKIGGNIIATVAVEIQAAAIIGAENLQSLNGLTPEEHRASTGGVVHRLK